MKLVHPSLPQGFSILLQDGTSGEPSGPRLALGRVATSTEAFIELSREFAHSQAAENP
jgi:hypothetical protein